MVLDYPNNFELRYWTWSNPFSWTNTIYPFQHHYKLCLHIKNYIPYTSFNTKHARAHARRRTQSHLQDTEINTAIYSSHYDMNVISDEYLEVFYNLIKKKSVYVYFKYIMTFMSASSAIPISIIFSGTRYASIFYKLMKTWISLL